MEATCASLSKLTWMELREAICVERNPAICPVVSSESLSLEKVASCRVERPRTALALNTLIWATLSALN